MSEVCEKYFLISISILFGDATIGYSKTIQRPDCLFKLLSDPTAHFVMHSLNTKQMNDKTSHPNSIEELDI